MTVAELIVATDGQINVLTVSANRKGLRMNGVQLTADEIALHLKHVARGASLLDNTEIEFKIDGEEMSILHMADRYVASLLQQSTQ